MKVVVIGGVAAGAGAAAKLRRLDETAEIVMLERGPHISYANCGLPYHVGGVIPQRDSLLVMTPEKFSAWFNVDIRTHSEVLAIDRDAKSVTVRGPDRKTYTENYDKLIIATGSSPVQPKFPGVDDPRVMRLWTIPDMDALMARVDAGARRAVVVGAGFIGLETAENLRERGLEVTVVELCDQVLPTLDKEMAVYLSQELAVEGIDQRLGRRVTALEPSEESLTVVLDGGEKIPTDLAVICVGVKPNSELARDAGLELGPRGHIVTNQQLQTSDPAIYAAGDVIEVDDPVTGGKTIVPLAGPANKQARIVAQNIFGAANEYHGTLGAAVLKLGRQSAASVGLTERRLIDLKIEYRKIYTHPASNATYYPGGEQMHVKLLFAPDGKILGAQAVGLKGVDKRIDTIAVAMCAGLSVRDLAELEMCYAPPFNSAKDPVNFVGMVATNVLDGDSRIVHANAIPADAFIVDVSEEAEIELGTIPGALNLPLSTLRQNHHKLDKKRKIVVTCRVGLRGYLAERQLRLHGFEVYNLSGGLATWKQFNPAPFLPCRSTPVGGQTAPTAQLRLLDVRALACPGPVVQIKMTMDAMTPNEALKLLAPTSFEADLSNWLSTSGNNLVSLVKREDHLEAVIRKCSQLSASTTTAPAAHSAAIVLFSNDLDKALAALILASGLAAAGAKVGIFFTFWGLSVLRRNPAPTVKKSLISRMFGMMLPKGAKRLALSKMHLAGMGSAMMKQVMASQQVPTLPELLQQARALGVKFIACDMAMAVMGITREELIDVDEVAGVASFAALARSSNNTLFI